MGHEDQEIVGVGVGAVDNVAAVSVDAPRRVTRFWNTRGPYHAQDVFGCFLNLGVACKVRGAIRGRNPETLESLRVS